MSRGFGIGRLALEGPDRVIVGRAGRRRAHSRRATPGLALVCRTPIVWSRGAAFMKLTEIQIDRYGIWRNVTLPVRADGASVFYGPNEAGKSSLRRFIRGVLFGFSSHSETHLPTDGQLSAAGSLQIEDASGRRRIHRAAVAGSAGDARLITDEAAVPVSAAQPGIAAEIDAQLFDRI